ncbi:hypothetical protein ABRY61_10670, partial [Lactobacillus helveticus]|uniref:hypothetical protein n=1 Tax=Lactobacillus helveticus TaxID=1587 RepID=UPI0032EEF886
FYFITTSYWTTTIMVRVITIGCAIANNTNLNLRGETIYPTEIDEIVNWKTMIPMVGKQKVIIISFALEIVISMKIIIQK